MLEWLKDWLGINRYVLVWSVPYPDMDWVMSGRNDRAESKLLQGLIARDMNKDYGAGTHWIERI